MEVIHKDNLLVIIQMIILLWFEFLQKFKVSIYYLKLEIMKSII